MIAGLPSRAFSWYGDDFTGSTDVLEAMAPHLPAVLFLRQPDASEFAPFRTYAAFGLAGSSRSETPAWMDAHLPEAFDWLKSLDTAVCLYKTCSTFDSSPQVGNIGRAMEIGRRVFGARFIPIVAGAPSLRRYTFYGNLFAAAADGKVYRIDRHPGMCRHPVTPMDEADLRMHLSRQTELRIGLLDAVTLDSATAREKYRDTSLSSDAVLIDVANEQALAPVGGLLWETGRQRFIAGSSGAAYALIAHWNHNSPATLPPPAPEADRIIVLSGSCSPVTARQVDFAGCNGYTLVPIPVTESALDDACVTRALRALATTGARGVVMYTSRSENDRVPLTSAGRLALSERAGRILRQVLDESGVRRAVIAGGDTASHAGRQLGITALTFLTPLAPGAPLCRAWPSGLEVVFKGGQCGQDNFFESVRKGSSQ